FLPSQSQIQLGVCKAIHALAICLEDFHGIELSRAGGKLVVDGFSPLAFDCSGWFSAHDRDRSRLRNSSAVRRQPTDVSKSGNDNGDGRHAYADGRAWRQAK